MENHLWELLDFLGVLNWKTSWGDINCKKYLWANTQIIMPKNSGEELEWYCSMGILCTKPFQVVRVAAWWQHAQAFGSFFSPGCWWFFLDFPSRSLSPPTSTPKLQGFLLGLPACWAGFRGRFWMSNIQTHQEVIDCLPLGTVGLQLSTGLYLLETSIQWAIFCSFGSSVAKSLHPAATYSQQCAQAISAHRLSHESQTRRHLRLCQSITLCKNLKYLRFPNKRP